MQRSLQLNSKSKNTNSTIRSLTASSMFAAFPKELASRLRALAILRKFSNGQIIQQRGDAATGFYIVQTGQIKIGRLVSDGTFRVVLIMGPGDSYGELAVLGGFPRVVDVIALGEVELLWISAAEFDRMLTDSPETARELLRIIAQQFQEALDNIVAHRHLSKSQQLARIISTLVKDHELPVKLNLGQSDLAELIGTSRVTVSKTLADLETKRALKRGYGSLTIFDMDVLKSF